MVNTTYYINVRENRRVNPNWTIQTLAALGTHDTEQHNITQKTKKMSNMDTWLIVYTI